MPVTCEIQRLIIRVNEHRFFFSGRVDVFSEIHRSNMTKVVDGKVVRREDGKILKPDTYEKPNIEAILRGGEQ